MLKTRGGVLIITSLDLFILGAIKKTIDLNPHLLHITLTLE